MLRDIYAYIEILLDLIYPPDIKCIVCGEEEILIDKIHICNSCYNRIEFIYGYEKTMESLEFNRIYSIVAYNNIAKKMIFNLKYYDQLYIAKTIALLMSKKIIELEVDFDLLVAVPLHKLKEKQRGYNQAHLICKHLRRILGKEYKNRVLERTRYTEDMNKLSRTKRFENIEGAFRVKNNSLIYNKRVILVDDVFTTGATANACAKALINAGAKSVDLLTFARGYI